MPSGCEPRQRRMRPQLTAEAQDYADRTLAELSDTLHRAAATADQGRARAGRPP